MKPYIHKVQYYETDRMGITHHSNYIRFMEEARTDFLEQIGWSYKKLEDAGAASPVTAIECRFRAPTTYSDIISIEVGIEAFTGARLVIGYTMRNEAGAVVCEASSEHCFVSGGRPIRLRKEFPEFAAVLDSLKDN